MELVRLLCSLRDPQATPLQRREWAAELIDHHLPALRQLDRELPSPISPVTELLAVQTWPQAAGDDHLREWLVAVTDRHPAWRARAHHLYLATWYPGEAPDPETYAPLARAYRDFLCGPDSPPDPVIGQTDIYRLSRWALQEQDLELVLRLRVMSYVPTMMELSELLGKVDPDQFPLCALYPEALHYTALRTTHLIAPWMVPVIRILIREDRIVESGLASWCYPEPIIRELTPEEVFQIVVSGTSEAHAYVFRSYLQSTPARLADYSDAQLDTMVRDTPDWRRCVLQLGESRLWRPVFGAPRSDDYHCLLRDRHRQMWAALIVLGEPEDQVSVVDQLVIERGLAEAEEWCASCPELLPAPGGGDLERHVHLLSWWIRELPYRSETSQLALMRDYVHRQQLLEVDLIDRLDHSLFTQPRLVETIWPDRCCTHCTADYLYIQTEGPPPGPQWTTIAGRPGLWCRSLKGQLEECPPLAPCLPPRAPKRPVQ